MSNTPIEKTMLSLRSKNGLLNNGIRYWEEVLELSEERLMKFRNLGRKSVSEIIELKNKSLHIDIQTIDSVAPSGIKIDALIFHIFPELLSCNTIFYRFKDLDGITVDDIRIDETDLPPRVSNPLLFSGYISLRQVIQTKLDDLKYIKNLGAGSLTKLTTYVKEHIILEPIKDQQDNRELIQKVTQLFLIRSNSESIVDEVYCSSVERLIRSVIGQSSSSTNDLYQLTSLIMQDDRFLSNLQEYLRSYILDNEPCFKSQIPNIVPDIINKAGLTLSIIDRMIEQKIIRESDSQLKSYLPTIEEWVASLPKMEKEIIDPRLDGASIGEIGNALNVTRQRIHQKIQQIGRKKPLLDEDVSSLSHWYTTYRIPKDRMMEIFGMPSRTYEYFHTFYKHGDLELLDIQKDPLITQDIHEKLRFIFDESSSLQNRNDILQNLAIELCSEKRIPVSLLWEKYCARIEQYSDDSGLICLSLMNTLSFPLL